MSGPLLLEKAKFFANELEILDFKQSTGWLDRFKENHGITLKNGFFLKKYSDSQSC